MAATSSDAGSKSAATSSDAGCKSTETSPTIAIRELASGQRAPARWLFILMVIEFAGFAMLIPVIPFFLINEIGLGPSTVGLLLSANSIAQLIGAWLSGRLSDSFGRLPLLVAVFTWAGLGFGAMAFVTTVAAVFAVRVAQGFSGGTSALCDAYLLDIIPVSARPSYVGLSGAVKGVAFIIGPGVASMLIHWDVTRRNIFLVAGGFALLSAGLAIIFLEESLRSCKRRPLCGGSDAAVSRLDGQDGVGVSDWQVVNQTLMCIVFCRFWSAMGLGFLFSTYAFLIKDNFGWEDSQFGMVLAITGFFGAIIQLLAFPVLVGRVGAPCVLAIGSLFGVASFLLFPEISLATHYFALVCFTCCSACTETVFPLLIGQYVSDRHLGLANGVASSFRCAATVLTPLVAGSLYDVSARCAYYTAAGCYLCCVVGAVTLCLSAPSFDLLPVAIGKFSA